MEYILGVHLEPSDIILDVGCWNGGQTQRYAKYCECIGLELSQLKLKNRVRNPHMQYLRGDWNHIPLTHQCVDWCVWDEGPEHAIEPEVVLREIAYVAKKGAVLTVPMAPDAAIRLTHKFLKGESSIWSGGHLHEFTEETLRNLIEKHFKVETLYTLTHKFPGYTWLVGIGVK